MFSVPGLPACLPKDMVTVEGNLLSEYRRKSASQGDSCPYECRRTEYELTTSSSVINLQALTDYVNQPAVLANQNRTEPLDMS